MKISLIITAGGTSTRYGAKNKLLETINGKTIIEHTVSAFKNIDEIDEIIIPTNSTLIPEFQGCFKNNKKIKIINGGENRQRSVYNAIMFCNSPDYVIIHDGARPLIKEETIRKCLQKAQEKGGAIVAAKITDTIKRVNQNLEIVSTEPRENLYGAQTPQIFRFDLIKSAHEQLKNCSYTDDALLFEELKIPVYIVEGEKSNIKLTYESDLLFIKSYLLNT